MDMRIEAMLEFLDNAHSSYHAAAAIVWELEAAGYIGLSESEKWELEAGGKYYLTRNSSTVIAFRIPQQKPTGFMISASHVDRPTFKYKGGGEVVDKYTRMGVEQYGGMLMSTWLDRPLSLAGRVLVETEEGIETRLVDIDRDLLMIPNLAIHMNRKANEGVPLNVAVDMLPLIGDKEDQGKLDALLEEVAGGKILAHDLFLYPRQKTSVWGMENQYFSASGIDDSECAWCCAQGFLQSREAASIPVLCVFDSEEVGSCTRQGAASGILEDVLDRVCQALELDRHSMLAQSFMVSADNAHGLHPNHPEVHDPKNTPMMNQGVAIKFHSMQKYSTDGASAAVFRKICKDAGVPLQAYHNRADSLGGSTLGYLSLDHVSVLSVDIGLPQLAMHSCYETAGVQDAIYMMEAMEAYYSASLECPADGIIIVK